MDNDDRQVGRVLSRREALRLLGATGAVMLAGQEPGRAAAQDTPTARTALPDCIVTPAQTEGPYYRDVQLDRSDIRTDPTDGSVRSGVPLRLTLRVLDISRNRCSPAAGAVVDVWHCDALGLYSGVRDVNRLFDTSGKKFLRGYQTTDADGTVRFVTIYPGWYPGRTVHIHFKVRSEPRSNQQYEFTSQLYFDDRVTDRVHALEPYASRGRRSVTNAGDGIFRDGGDLLTLSLDETDQGYAARFDVGLYTSGQR